jgi:hypothetical protein
MQFYFFLSLYLECIAVLRGVPWACQRVGEANRALKSALARENWEHSCLQDSELSDSAQQWTTLRREEAGRWGQLQDLGSEFSVPPGSKPHVAGRQLQKLSNPPSVGSGSVPLVSAAIYRQWRPLPATQDGATGPPALHSPSLLLSKLLSGSVSNTPVPQNCHRPPKHNGRLPQTPWLQIPPCFQVSRATQAIGYLSRWRLAIALWDVESDEMDFFPNAGLQHKRNHCHTKSPLWI